MTMFSRRDFARRAACTSAAWLGLAGLAPTGFAEMSRKKKTQNAPQPPAPVVPNILGSESLRAHAKLAGYRVGCAVVPELLDLEGAQGAGTTDPYTQQVIAQADIVVGENAMKWSALRPTPETYNFAPADKLLAFASAFGQVVRGHNLCWHEQLPGWFASVATAENARDLLTKHIQTVAGRYAGRIQSWDVVNEAVHPPDGRADGLRKSPWLELIGPEYIELAFRTAAAADPGAKLTYNDYDIELDTAEQTTKRGQVLALVRRLQARGIPIQAVGIQSHLQATGPVPGAGLIAFIRELAQMGLEVYVTEMDVNSRLVTGDDAVQDAAVAKVYHDYLRLLLPEPNVKAVLTWGISDAHTWLNNTRQPWARRADGARQRPLPLDEHYQPTPAFFAMRAALDANHAGGRPTADVLAPPDAQGPNKAFQVFAVPGSPQPAPQER